MTIKKLLLDRGEIRLIERQGDNYISLTDLTDKFVGGGSQIMQWMRKRETVEFLGMWENMHNPNFLLEAFQRIYEQTSQKEFVLDIESWIQQTNCIGLEIQEGRRKGIYAHPDIAFQFCYWLSPTFQLFIIKEFQRLKKEESGAKNIEWNVKRIMAKASYPIQTDAIRQHLIPPKVQNTKGEGMYFASEADLLNVALFGLSARQWREQNPTAKGNIRDNATHEQLLILSILQGLNAKLLEWGSDKDQRLEILNKSAIEWMQLVLEGNGLSKLPSGKQKKLE